MSLPPPASRPALMVVRCDASPAIGTGHAMRCIALAASSGSAHFLCGDALPAAIRERAEASCGAGCVHTVPYQLAGCERDALERDAAHCADLVAEVGASWVVCDSYDLDGTYTDALRRALAPRSPQAKIIFVDDNDDRGDLRADALLNANAHAPSLTYAWRGPGALFFLGPGYALLRDEFRAARDARGSGSSVAGDRNDTLGAPRPLRLLVTMGGADAKGVSARVVRALDAAASRLGPAGVEARVIAGPANLSLPEESGTMLSDRAQVLRGVSNMAEQMLWADAAVSASGSSTYELLFMGLPSVIIVTADNQEGIHAALGVGDNRAALGLGEAEAVTDNALEDAIVAILTDAALRSALVGAAATTVDGKGPSKITAALEGREWTRE